MTVEARPVERTDGKVMHAAFQSGRREDLRALADCGATLDAEAVRFLKE